MPAVILLAALLLPPAPREIVFVRHGETVANATGRYNSKTIDTFSERGGDQVAALTGKLAGMRFDRIVVSPSPRALRTIAPYLRRTGRKAEIWPELYECCDAHSRKQKGPSSPELRFTTPIRVPTDLSPLFTLKTDRLPHAPSYEDGLMQIELTATELRRLSGTVLVVGHSLHGGRLLELLQGKPMSGTLRPGNTEVIRLTAGGDGRYRRQ